MSVRNYSRRNPIIEEDLASICAHDLPWSTFCGKTVLVSGASGFLPAYMVETLLYLNDTAGIDCRVIGLVRDQEKSKRRFAHVFERGDFRLLVQDVCAPIELGKLCESQAVQFIIHAASQASPKYYGKDPAGTLLANTVGTYNLLELARKHELEGFLFFSSGDVYGRVSQDRPIKEDDYGWLDPTDVRSCYGESKRLGENMCVAWHHQYGVPTKIVRIAHTYGPGLALDDGRVFADFVGNIVRNEDIILKSDGTARRPFLYLADATLAFFTVLLRGEIAQPYNVANEGGDISVKDLAQLLVRIFPERKLAVKFVRGESLPGYIPSKIQGGIPDTSKIRRLGWAPTTSLEEGFRRTVMSFGCEGDFVTQGRKASVLQKDEPPIRPKGTSDGPPTEQAHISADRRRVHS